MINNRNKKLFFNIIVFALGTLGSKLILFFLIPLYTRVLTTEQYGIADLIVTVGQLVVPVISLTIYNGLLRFGMMADIKREDVLNCFVKIFFFGCLLMTAVTPFFRFYKTIAEYRWYLCLFVITFFSSQSGLIYLKVKDKNLCYSILCILQAIIIVSCNIVFLFVLKMGINGYILSIIIAYAVTTLLTIYFGQVFYDLKNSFYSKTLLKRMIIYSIPFIFNDISWWIIHSSDKIMIDFMLNSDDLGIYTVASKIPSIINIVITIFNQAWVISSIDAYNEGNIKEFYSRVFNMFFIVLAVSTVIMLLILKPFMSLYVGKDFYNAWIYVPILLAAAFFSGISSFFDAIYKVLLKSRNIMATTAIAAVSNIILNYIFILLFGLWGALIGTLGAYLLITVIRMIDVKKLLEFKYYIFKFLLNSLLIIGCSILISIHLNIYICSGLALILFLVINCKDIMRIIYKGVNVFKIYIVKFKKQ